MSPFESSFKTVVAINFNLLAAAGCGFVAWAIWPTSIEWWGFGLIGLLLAAMAITSAGKAVRMAMELRAKNRAMAEFLAQGGGYRPAQVVGEYELEVRGMLDE